MENYIKEKWYDGLGKYIGVINIYPYNEPYIIKAHRFVGEPPKGRECPVVREIEIERVPR